MINDLFNQSLLKKYCKHFKLNPSKHDLIKEYLSKLESGDFKAETKNYLYFYDVVLKKLLGYKREDVLFDEKEDQGVGKSEFVLHADNKKFMIIELKGQGIDLDKKQKGRSDNKSPVEQAFGYAIHTGDVEWIMVSNYNEYRLYNYHDKTKYISFNASELIDKETYSYFMLALSKKSHLESDYIKRIHEGTLLVDRKLASEFYKLYNETRLMLIKELQETSKLDKLEAIKYAQLILNRYMFICFAEDVDLLPSQISVDTIATPIQKGNLRHGSIWQRLNELFQDVNEGNEYKDIAEYNGGLFLDDLESMRIRDIVEDQDFFNDIYQKWNFEVYEKNIDHLLGSVGNKVNPIFRNLLMISSFDFSTELDVNILGHIFENSIGDIEELKEDNKGRRKKEGIFYTPDYITDYICKNTIIPYLSKSGKINTIADLLEEYSWSNRIEDLDEKLKNIKIIDPACGSGAFLNKATDILLEIHEGVFDIKKGYTTSTDMRVGKGKRRRTESIQHADLRAWFDPIEKRREILINNIYGVDLNEESVDITKLSLFLKVCRKNLKLPNLDKNIKNGNSLIDDPKYTDKPFNWEKEFSEIFRDGGFDIVIGNPPYVRQEKIKEIKPYLKDHYEVYTGVADLYVYFFERGLNVLNERGIFSFICSDKFTKAKYGEPLRKFILNHGFLKYNEYKGKGVFEDATVDPCVMVLKNNNSDDLKEVIVNDGFKVPYNRLYDDIWNFVSPQVMDLKEKIESKGIKIKDIKGLNIYRGVLTGLNEAFIVDEATKNKLIEEDLNNSNIIKPLISGKDIQPWNINYNDSYLIFTKRGIDINQYPSILNYLELFKEKLMPKKPGHKIGRKPGNYEWYEIQDSVDYYLEFEKEKLVYPEIKQFLFSVYDDQKFFVNKTCFIMTSTKCNLKYLNVLMTSKTLDFYFKLIANPIARTSTDPTEKVRYGLSKIFVEQLPIILTTFEKQQPFIKIAEQMIQLNHQLQEEANGFKHWIKKEFNIDKLSKKLEKYYELSEDEFIDELRKKKVNTKSRKNREYLEREFDESVAIIKPLLQKIEETDNEIDQMVYELYGFTEDEIRIIEDD